jgi:hypothetical protein
MGLQSDQAASGGLSREGLRVAPSFLLAGIVMGAGIQNLILLPFLGFHAAVAVAALIPLLGIAVIVGRNTGPAGDWVTGRRFAICVAVAAALFVLGGEGRFFYANTDWQVRDAVLNDMIRNDWPFAYTARGTAEILRAPIAMYLLPALVGKLAGLRAAELSMLAQNALFLGTILTLGSMLFRTGKARLIALLVFLLFSGLDLLGQLIVDAGVVLDPRSHLENWSKPLQFSSTITLAFWVPQHALAGWCGAILFLLRQRRMIPLAAFLTPLPLLALWSPLALIGLLPFAAYALAISLALRESRPRDLLLPAVSIALCLPALLYLQAGSGAVGMRFYPVPPLDYLRFQILELLPYAAPLLALSWRKGAERGPFLLATSALFILPFVQIGTSSDLMMRGSIPALAILAALTAEALSGFRSGERRLMRASRGILVTALALGSITGAHEVARAVMVLPSPYPECSLLGVWRDSLEGADTYVAALDAVPKPIRPANPAAVPLHEPAECWSRSWLHPR